MTPEERQKAFVDAYNALVQQFGFVLEPAITYEVLGTSILCKPNMSLKPVENWQPQLPKDVGNLIPDTAPVPNTPVTNGVPVAQSNGAVPT